MEKFIHGLWSFLALSAPYLLMGFALSGLVHILLPLKKIKSWLGSHRIRDIFYASIIGIPLPLCSCGVIPAAVSLKKSGASRASVSAFLISTPESGIDSILVTYALMDFPMSIFRPISAFITATMAGLLNHFFNREQPEVKFSAVEEKSCCHANEVKHEHTKKETRGIFYKIVHYGFVELVDDIAVWMSIGILLGASMSVFIPDDFFLNLSPTTSRVVILLVGIPMYICASASTPIAASLVLKGMTPGVALILLLAGPATNIANIAVLQKHLGLKGTLINLFSISACALGLSYVVDYYYEIYGPANFKLEFQHDHIGMFEHVAAALLVLLLLSSFYRIYVSKKISHANHK